MGLFDKLFGGTDLLKMIRDDKSLTEYVGAICSLDLYPSPQTPYGADDILTFSIQGMAFGRDGGGGEFVLLPDGSIGYTGQKNECGRIAESLREYFELEINCVYGWFNYGVHKYIENPNLLAQQVVALEAKGRDYFTGAYGDEIGSYDELRDKIAKALRLKISDDISKDILPKFFKATTRKPLYYKTHRDTGLRSDDLVR